MRWIKVIGVVSVIVVVCITNLDAFNWSDWAEGKDWGKRNNVLRSKFLKTRAGKFKRQVYFTCCFSKNLFEHLNCEHSCKNSCNI